MVSLKGGNIFWKNNLLDQQLPKHFQIVSHFLEPNIADAGSIHTQISNAIPQTSNIRITQIQHFDLKFTDTLKLCLIGKEL